MTRLWSTLCTLTSLGALVAGCGGNGCGLRAGGGADAVPVLEIVEAVDVEIEAPDGEKVPARSTRLMLDGVAIEPDAQWPVISDHRPLRDRLTERGWCEVELGPDLPLPEPAEIVLQAPPGTTQEAFFPVLRAIQACQFHHIWLRVGEGGERLGPLDTPRVHWPCGSGDRDDCGTVTGTETWLTLLTYQDELGAAVEGHAMFQPRCSEETPCGVSVMDVIGLDTREHRSDAARHLVQTPVSALVPVDCAAVLADRPEAAAACRAAATPGAPERVEPYVGPSGCLVTPTLEGGELADWRGELAASLRTLGLGEGCRVMLMMEPTTRFEAVAPLVAGIEDAGAHATWAPIGGTLVGGRGARNPNRCEARLRTAAELELAAASHLGWLTHHAWTVTYVERRPDDPEPGDVAKIPVLQAPEGSRALLVITWTQATGAPDPYAVIQRLDEVVPALATCFDPPAMATPVRNGLVHGRVAYAASGAVDDAGVLRNSRLAQEVGDCVDQELAGLAIPAPADGQPSLVDLELELRILGAGLP